MIQRAVDPENKRFQSGPFFYSKSKMTAKLKTKIDKLSQTKIFAKTEWRLGLYHLFCQQSVIIKQTGKVKMYSSGLSANMNSALIQTWGLADQVISKPRTSHWECPATSSLLFKPSPQPAEIHGHRGHCMLHCAFQSYSHNISLCLYCTTGPYIDHHWINIWCQSTISNSADWT